MVVLNYPNSPTGKVADVDFYLRVIELAHQHKFIVVQDAAHILLSYDSQPLSFLSVPGARDVGVEVHSLSKGFDMIGWRIGWVCGNAKLVQAFADVKDNCDSGQFSAVQQAAVTALDTPAIPEKIRGKYQRRLQNSWPPSSTVALNARCQAELTSCMPELPRASKADRDLKTPNRPVSTSSPRNPS